MKGLCGLGTVRTMRAVAVVGVMTACTPTSVAVAGAVPETSPVLEQLATILALPQHRKAVLDAARHSTTWLRHGCQIAAFTPLPGAKIWIHPTFAANGTVVSGIWRESIVAAGCGMTRVLNVVTKVSGPNAMTTGPVAPGLTRGNLILQMDARNYAQPLVHNAAPLCESAYLDDTSVLAPHPAGIPPHTPWSEIWKIDACGVPVNVQFDFTPDATGTGIAAHIVQESAL